MFKFDSFTEEKFIEFTDNNRIITLIIINIIGSILGLLVSLVIFICLPSLGFPNFVNDIILQWILLFLK